MSDQAQDLRQLMRAKAAAEVPRVSVRPSETPAATRAARLTVVASGKGGVGTTSVAVNLAAAMAARGRRVTLVDAAWNGTDVANLCGVQTPNAIAAVLGGVRSLEQSLLPGPSGVRVLTGAWGLGHMVECSPAAHERLLADLRALGDQTDEVVVDVGSGLNRVVRRFWHAADALLLVTTPDPVATMDAYAAIKVLLDGRRADLYTVINGAANAQLADQVHQRMAHACLRFLGLRIQAAGYLPWDAHLHQAAAQGRVAVLEYPASAIGLALANLADEFLEASAAQDKPAEHGRQPWPAAA